MSRGFAFLIALVVLILAIVLTSILLAYGAMGGDSARRALEIQLAQRAAERAIEIALERAGQKAARSYFGDPVESYYWYGGDLPGGSILNLGTLANDGEIFGFDTGLDGLPDLLEPRFSPGDNGDPSGDNRDPINSRGLRAEDFFRLEGNGRYDLPLLSDGGFPILVGIPGNSPDSILQRLGDKDISLGPDGVSSFREVSRRYATPRNFVEIPYHPIANCDPAGDDYHPVWNPNGEEGRVADVSSAGVWTYLGPTVETANRWRRAIHKITLGAEFNDGNLDEYSSIRAVDTATKIDLNGPSLLTARLINSLIQVTAVSPGPITVRNPALGTNHRGIEAVDWVNPAPNTIPGTINLEIAQHLLLPVPGFGSSFSYLNSPTAPRKLASTQQEEERYFHEPANALDSDAALIIKYRNRDLDGRFSSVSQLLEIRRLDGSRIFDERSRDELLRLSSYLTIEAWRDPAVISSRNAEPLSVSALAPQVPELQWDPMAVRYVPAEPWQDIFRNGVFEGGERFADVGLNGTPSSDPIQFPNYDLFRNPDPDRDDFHPIWNPYFVRRFWLFDASYHILKSIDVVTSRYGVRGYSPFQPSFYSLQALPHLHYSSLDASFPPDPHVHAVGLDADYLDFDMARTFFNLDASEGNGYFDVDPYVGLGGVASSEALPSVLMFPSEWDLGIDGLDEAHGDRHGDGFMTKAVFLGRQTCDPNQEVWWRSNPSGSEGNSRLDPFPEVFQMPEGPLGARLGIPLWVAGDSDSFLEPGERFFDHGRDRIPNTGDPGEGDGVWEPGEEFLDFGLDGVPDWAEQAYGDAGLSIPLSNCDDPAQREDYHRDNFRVVSGVAVGTEGDGRFNLIREPFLDFNRNGIWDAGHSVSQANASSDEGLVGGYFDLNQNGRYDSGVFRESRACVNLNEAPEETLAAVIYAGLILPAKKRQDRFLLTSLDMLPAQDDYDWDSVVRLDGVNPPVAHRVFAHNLARGLARAIFLRRLGLYASNNSAIGAGPFRSWSDFESFVRAVLGSSSETARFPQMQPNGVDFAGNRLVDPFSIRDISPVASQARELVMDRILIQANPNTRLLGANNYPYVNPTRFDKADFPFPTTEFSLGPTGIYEIDAVGYSVSAERRAIQSGPEAQVVGAGFSAADAQLLASLGVRATVELQRTVKVFEHRRLSTREDFESSTAGGRGVAVLPVKADPFANDASLAIDEIAGPSDRARVVSQQVSDENFLLVRPRVIAIDPKSGLFFAASDADPLTNPAMTTDPFPFDSQNTDPGATIQVFELIKGRDGAVTGFKTFKRNNGISQAVVDARGSTRRLGLIQPGRGFDTGFAAPRIAAMAFDSDFLGPRNWVAQNRYLGRLYVCDEQGQRLRAIDLGRDLSGELLSQEVSFSDPNQLSFSPSVGAGFYPAKIELVRERREIALLLRYDDPDLANYPLGRVAMQRYRYRDALRFPAVDAVGRDVLTRLGDPNFVGALGGWRTTNHSRQNLLGLDWAHDSGNSYIYLGGNYLVSGSAPDSHDVDMRIVRFAPDSVSTWDEQQLFPWNAQFMPPGYEILASHIPAVPSHQGYRELVDLELDNSSGLLFALWNRDSQVLCLEADGSTSLVGDFNHDGVVDTLDVDPFVDQIMFRAGGIPLSCQEDPNGDNRIDNFDINYFTALFRDRSGSFLAAFPTGAAPFLTTPLINPLPVEAARQRPSLDGVDPNLAIARTDNKWTYAAAMSLDPLSQSILICPAEQRCDDNPGVPGAFNPLWNPFAHGKNRINLISYHDDGLRWVDTLNAPSLWSDPASFGPNGRPQSPSIVAFPEQSLFLAATSVNQVTEWSEPPQREGCYVQRSGVDGRPWEISRQLHLWRLNSSRFTNDRSDESWCDGKLISRPDSVPLSTYLTVTQPGWSPSEVIHSRANLDSGVAFSQLDYRMLGISGDAPSYDMPTILEYQYPIAARSLPVQTNAQISGEGLHVDAQIKPHATGVLLNPSESHFDQRVVYPQDATGPVRRVENVNLRSSFDSGWSSLEPGAEFWIRFGDLRGFSAPSSGDVVLYENFVKVAGSLGGEEENNLFFREGRSSSLWNILQAQIQYLGMSSIGSGVTPQNILSVQFCPGRVEIWAYDRIALSDFDQDLDTQEWTARVVYERRLAAPAGQYPGIFGPDVREPWGTFRGCDGLFQGEHFSHPFEGIAGVDLGNEIEANKYPRVQIRWNSGSPQNPIPNETEPIPFSPIWSNGIVGSSSNPRQAAVRVTTSDRISLRGDRWLRVAYASKIDFDPSDSSNVARALMRPSTVEGETVLRVWDGAGLHATTSPEVIADSLGWFEFPGEREGFLAVGAHRSPAPGYPAETPRMGGVVEPGFSFTIDDIVIYERPLPVLEAGSNLASESVARFGVAEGGWPITVHAFPQTLAPYQPAEPFLDFDGDGRRTSDPAQVAFWDFSNNGRWDFDETRQFPDERGPSFSFFGEPFTDLNRNGRWDDGSRGDILIDLNENGVLDGEAFIDLNGDRVYEFGIDQFVAENDRNGNGICDGGEPFIDMNGDGIYTPRYGEPFVDRNANAGFDDRPVPETFFDENLNGVWDGGEPFSNWSRSAVWAVYSWTPPGPLPGELYRENLAVGGYQPANLAFPARGESGNTWSGNSSNFDWNNDGRYDSAGSVNGILIPSLLPGERLGSLAFTQWRPTRNVNEADVQARVSVDLELRARDGRFLGRWTGVDQSPGDESGIGLPIAAESRLLYRVHFLMPSPYTSMGFPTHPSSPAILDDLSMTIVLPRSEQTVFESRIVTSILATELARGPMLQ